MIRLKSHEVMAAFDALRSLKGYTKIVDDKPVAIPFDFTPKARFRMAEIQHALQPKALMLGRAAEPAQEKLRAASEAGDAAELARQRAELQALEEEQHEIDGDPLAKDDLNLDRNPISPDTIARLIPLMQRPA